MPPDKLMSSADHAVADIHEGAVIMVAGYAAPGTPQNLVKALLRKGVAGLTCITGPTPDGDPNLYGVSRLVAGGRVKRIITAPPVHPGLRAQIMAMCQRGRLEIELVAQGTLAERIRAGGAGLGGVFLPGPGPVGDGRKGRDETRTIDGEEYVLATPLKADFALLRAHRADGLGNLVYRRSQRNWNPVMATAADVTIVEVDWFGQPGELDPELVLTPGIYVDRIVNVEGEPDVRTDQP